MGALYKTATFLEKPKWADAMLSRLEAIEWYGWSRPTTATLQLLEVVELRPEGALRGAAATDAAVISELEDRWVHLMKGILGGPELQDSDSGSGSVKKAILDRLDRCLAPGAWQRRIIVRALKDSKIDFSKWCAPKGANRLCWCVVSPQWMTSPAGWRFIGANGGGERRHLPGETGRSRD